jgi:hypothetical protein
MVGILGLSRVPPGGRIQPLPVLRGLAVGAKMVLDDEDPFKSHHHPSWRGRFGGLSAIQTLESLLLRRTMRRIGHHAAIQEIRLGL